MSKMVQYLQRYKTFMIVVLTVKSGLEHHMISDCVNGRMVY
jgi:hypothetical protein